MAATHYLLNTDLFDSLICEFFHNKYPAFHFDINDDKGIKYVRFTLDQTKEHSGKLCCFFPHGKCSFNPQGKLDGMAKELQDYIIEHASIPNSDSAHKEISYRNVSEESINLFLSFIGEKYKIHDNGKNKNGDRQIIICGPYSSSVTITHYHTGTVLLQGILTSLLIDVLYHIEGIIQENKDTKEKSFVEQLSLPSHKIIDEDLSVHFPDRSHFDSATEDWLSSTFILLNAHLKLPDYTCILFGALKALESVMAKRIGINHPYSTPNPNLGSHFQDNPTGSKTNYFMTTKTYDSLPGLKAALEKGYNHYFDHRNGLFHVDARTIEMSRTIPTIEEANDLTLDTIKIINDILGNW